MTTVIARHLSIHGRVQGVGYRQSLYMAATRAGLSGWVRNRRDGTVEAILCGPAAEVDAVIAWAHRGPTLARVTSVDILECQAPADHGFTILATD